MPFSPDYSDYLRMKRIQKTIDVDSRIEARKTRSTYAYGSYNPTYRIGYLPPNLFLPGRLYPPAPEPPSGDFVSFASIDTTGGKGPAIVIRLIDVNSETKIDFGDDGNPDIRVITDNVPIVDHAYTSGTWDLKLSNPTNISEITIDLNQIVKTVRVAYFTGLTKLVLVENSSLTDVFGIPDTMRTISIQGTAINTCELMTAFAASLPDIISPDEGTVNYLTEDECSPEAPGWRFNFV